MLIYIIVYVMTSHTDNCIDTNCWSQLNQAIREQIALCDSLIEQFSLLALRDEHSQIAVHVFVEICKFP